MVKKRNKTQEQLRREEFSLVMREIRLADNRVNGKADNKGFRRAKWLLDFAHKDLSGLSQGQFSDVGWEVMAFALPGDPREDWHASTAFYLLTSHALKAANVIKTRQSFILKKTVKISESILRDFQNVLRGKFDSFFSGDGWENARPRTQEEIFCRGVKSSEGHYSADGKTWPPAGEYLTNLAFDLVKAEIDRFGVCKNPRCKNPFVSQKKGRGLFCSPRCSVYVRVNRKRGRELTDLGKA